MVFSGRADHGWRLPRKLEEAARVFQFHRLLDRAEAHAVRANGAQSEGRNKSYPRQVGRARQMQETNSVHGRGRNPGPRRPRHENQARDDEQAAPKNTAHPVLLKVGWGGGARACCDGGDKALLF